MSIFLDSTDWSFPVPISYGPKRIEELPAICIKHDIQRPLIVTDSGSATLPFIIKALKSLNSSGLKASVFSGISPNPLDTEILTGKSVYKDGKHDAVIAIGGGSGMDGGKAISLIANNNYS